MEHRCPQIPLRPQAMLLAVICAVALFVDVGLATQLWIQNRG